MIPQAKRHPRRPARRLQRGQVMVMFALVLPVVAGFLGLSMAASIEMDTRAALDGAALNAAVAASSDACMTSTYSYGLYECTAGANTAGYYSASINGHPALDPTPSTGALPYPNFTGCPVGHWKPSCTQCPQSINLAYIQDNWCIIDEHDIADYSADATINRVLRSDYPNFTVTRCLPPVGTPPSAALCTPTNSQTIEYSVRVSYWYYYDTNYPTPAAMFTTNEESSKDALDLGGSSAPCPASPNQKSPQSVNAGEICIDYPVDADRMPWSLNPTSTGPNKGLDNPTILTCPSTGSFARLIEVQTFSQFTNPFGGLLGINKIGLHSKAVTYGCSG